MIHLFSLANTPQWHKGGVSACDWGNPLKCFRGDPNLWQQLLFQNKFDAIWQQLLFQINPMPSMPSGNSFRGEYPRRDTFGMLTIGDVTDKFSDCATSHFTQIHLGGQSL
jgi:hypothetical protein